MRRTFACLLVALVAAACGESFKPETVVDSFRFLGMRADPPELNPGQLTAFEALLVDPRPGGKKTILWLGCEPDPFNLGRSVCSRTDQLADPSAFVTPTEGGGAQLPPGVSIIGFNDFARLAAKPDVFSQLPPGDARRETGTVAQIIALAVAEEVSPTAPAAELEAALERVRAREVDSQLALFRVRITEETSLNTNPVLGPLLVDDQPLPDGLTLRLRPGEDVKLELTAPDTSFEPYEQLTPSGREPREERLITAWYSTFGRFLEARVVMRSEVEQRFTAPASDDEALARGRAGTLWMVVRDTRGGQSWTTRALYVCDESLPAPSVTALSPDRGVSNGALRITLSGANLDALLEVHVDGRPLTDVISTATGFSGRLPSLAPGPHTLTLRGKNCRDELLPTHFIAE